VRQEDLEFEASLSQKKKKKKERKKEKKVKGIP
jgi:hypothetical protein